MNSSVDGICVVSCYFKIIEENYLEMHVHSRANNAYSLLLIDMQFMIGFQTYLSKINNLKIGNYYHFFDSTQFFKKDISKINQQYTYLNS